MPARPGSSTARASPRPIRASPRSATSTRPTARSASPCSHVDGRGARRCSARIQNELFDLGADLATPGEDFAPSEMALAHRARADRPARARDRPDERGSGAAAQLHPARRRRRRGRSSTSPARSCGGPSARRSRRRGGRSTRWRSPISTACRTICSCSRVGWRVTQAGTFSGSRARRATLTCVLLLCLVCYSRGGRRVMATQARPDLTRASRRATATVRAAQPRHRRAAVRRRRHHPADAGRLAGQMAPRPHDLVLRDLPAARPCARLPPARRALGLSVQLLLRRRGRAPRRAPRRGMLSRPSLDEIRAWRAAVDAALLAAIDDLPRAT